MGVLSKVNAYFGVVEAQGCGSLHLHIMMWLKNAPNVDEMHILLKSNEFQ